MKQSNSPLSGKPAPVLAVATGRRNVLGAQREEEQCQEAAGGGPGAGDGDSLPPTRMDLRKGL